MSDQLIVGGVDLNSGLSRIFLGHRDFARPGVDEESNRPSIDVRVHIEMLVGAAVQRDLKRRRGRRLFALMQRP